MTLNLEKQLHEINKKENEILKKIEERNKRKKIKCECCDKYHQIGKLTLIQTHFYVKPYSCTAGDYWLQGELQFICPKTEIRNRLLFNDYDVPYEERKKHENNSAEQFKWGYKHLFKEVVDEHEKRESSYEWVNNYYVDKNRKRFGLVEKRKQNDR